MLLPRSYPLCSTVSVVKFREDFPYNAIFEESLPHMALLVLALIDDQVEFLAVLILPSVSSETIGSMMQPFGSASELYNVVTLFSSYPLPSAIMSSKAFLQSSALLIWFSHTLFVATITGVLIFNCYSVGAWHSISGHMPLCRSVILLL